jgi:hypothetical protein
MHFEGEIVEKITREIDAVCGAWRRDFGFIGMIG